MRKFFLVASLLLLTITKLVAQRYHTDTVYHMPASKFWGNSFYIAAGINLARNHEYEFNLGRTYGQAHWYPRGMGGTKTHTWGFGYAYSPVLSGTHTVKAFYERGIARVLYFANHTVRGEYIYNVTGQQHYFRPFVGFNASIGVIGYNYSFLLNKNNGPNIYRHGLSIRLNKYFSRKKWFRTLTSVR
jgi:hypothetical protein